MSTYVGKLITAVSAALEFNTATLSGAIDVIVIQDPKSGKRQSTPFHVRFGKLQLLKTRGIPINIEINGQRTALRMFLGAAGEAYFYNPPSPKTESSTASSSVERVSEKDEQFTPSAVNIVEPSESAPQLSLSTSAKLSLNAETEKQQGNPNVLQDNEIKSEPALKPPPLSSPLLTSHQSQTPDPDFLINFVSDSEVELTRTVREGSTAVVEEPRSPPLPIPRRSWDVTTPSSNLSVHPPPPSSSTVISSPAKTVTVATNTIAEESENSALFGLPSTPRRPRTSSVLDLPSEQQGDGAAKDVTVSAEFSDVVVEEERKLELRSMDGYDTDDEEDEVHNSDELVADSSTIPEVSISEGDAALNLHRHLTRVLSSSQSVELIKSDDDINDSNNDNNPQMNYATDTNSEVLSMSLCGDLISDNMKEEHIVELFDRHRLTFDDVTSNPNFFSDPKLMFRLQNRIVDSRVAVPYLLTALAFNKCLDFDVLSRATEQSITDKGEEGNDFGSATTEPSKSPQTPSRRFRWFGWASQPVVGEPLLEEEDISALEKNNAKEEDSQEAVGEEKSSQEVPRTTEEQNQSKPDEPGQVSGLKREIKIISTKSEEENAAGRFQETVEDHKEEGTPGADITSTLGPGDQKTGKEDEGDHLPEFSDLDPSCLSLQPTSEQLESLPLEEGANSMRFFVDESTAEINCRVFLWSEHSKIVISDVDGTITRSDVLGHLLPAVGRDWSQVGVAGLYTQIEKNGYKVLYLTARPIGQASQTRAFLHNVTQGSAKLPNGPVLMSPNRLVESFTREVILRKPHEFKIAALREVRNLFPPDYNPFHAGFGNRDTDVISYRAVGLIPQRIFVVNPRGELLVMKQMYESAASYSNLTDLVEKVFPDISGYGELEKIQTLTINSTFNDWHYWRGALPDLNVEELLKK